MRDASGAWRRFAASSALLRLVSKTANESPLFPECVFGTERWGLLRARHDGTSWPTWKVRDRPTIWGISVWVLRFNQLNATW